MEHLQPPGASSCRVPHIENLIYMCNPKVIAPVKAAGMKGGADSLKTLRSLVDAER